MGVTKARNWIRHAFAIEDPDAIDLSESESRLVDRICGEVARRRLTTPALLVLEMHRPFNYVSAQALHFLEPIVTAIADPEGYRAFARFLEQRGSIDYLIRRIQSLERDPVFQAGATKDAGQDG